MAKMKIWRLEDSEGAGVYRGGNYYLKATWDDDEDCNNVNRHPTPHNDDALGFYDIHSSIRYDYIFGFTSLSQMHQWVYRAKWRRALTNMSIQLNCYEVDSEHVRRSPFQAIFNKNYAKLVESRKPNYRD